MFIISYFCGNKKNTKTMKKYIVILHLFTLCQFALSQNIVLNQEHSRLRLPNDIIDSICIKQDSTDIYMSSIDGIIINGVSYKLSIDTNLSGKKMVWFGTSIPVQRYPEIVGTKLGITCYNESQGSSCCRKGNVVTEDAFGDDIGIAGVSWQNIVLSLSMSQAEKLRLFQRWTTENRKARMISEDGYTSTQVENVVGYGELLGGNFVGEDGAPTGQLPSSKPRDFMNDAYINSRKFCYSCSWDSSEDIESGFGVIEGKVEKYLNAEDKPDIWVFDHGHNDAFANGGYANMATVPTDPQDRSYFIGAASFIFNKILAFDPHARIVIIGHYTDNAKGTGHPVETTQGQQTLASLWQFPLIKLWELLPVSPGIRVTTTGYWDSNKVWHDTGYDGSPTYQHASGYDELTGTNKNSSFLGTNHYGGNNTSGNNNNVRQVNGVWVHDLTMKQIWMFDDLHPSTTQVKDLFSDVLASQFSNLFNR